MNITSKNGIALLKEINKEESEYIVILVHDNGSETCHSFKGDMKLSNLSDIMEVAYKCESVVKVEVIERTKTLSMSVKPIHCVDIQRKTFKQKRNRTSYLRTRTK